MSYLDSGVSLRRLWCRDSDGILSKKSQLRPVLALEALVNAVSASGLSFVAYFKPVS
jgi:hypothetical protein